ncbi:MAG: SPOR domain-containing protein [Gammaproteobacteria bacterium]|nr:MAG: SPOR domain-containing protein [Gammaproteobacteria bacterium]
MATRTKDLKGRSSMSAKKPLPGYVWLLAGLAIGLFVAFLVYLKKQPPEQVSFKEAVVNELQKAKQGNTTDTAKKDSKPQGKEPRFDFYTILPELEVFIPEPEIKRDDPPAASTGSPSVATTSGTQYLLQAGSFRNHEDAERLKANLALLGVQSSIQSVSVNNDTWHRVRIGPYSSSQKVHETLRILKQNNIHAMTMELKK